MSAQTGVTPFAGVSPVATDPATPPASRGARLANSTFASPATEADRDFLHALFEQCLSPYYSGDHVAHADRVLDAHLAAGTDQYGHFSLAQRTFVLRGGDDGENRLGVLHLVRKRQDTMKISPLALAPEYRGLAGLGSLLLRMAEDYARSMGARQLYCTVAADNTQALEFFLRHDFIVAGRSEGQYKAGAVEHMLYKPLGAWTARKSPDADEDIAIRLYEPADEPELRRLVRTTLGPAFRGAGDDWVDALIAGHGRRESRDVNTKYKIIHMAVDRTGRVRGAAGAGPKKGDPVKVMPLCADSPDVLEKIVRELPAMLAGMGRKVYVHATPEPAMTMAMQRNGWRLEGLLPAAYHPEHCVVQWGLPLSTETTASSHAHDGSHHD